MLGQSQQKASARDSPREDASVDDVAAAAVTNARRRRPAAAVGAVVLAKTPLPPASGRETEAAFMTRQGIEL